MSCQNQIIDYLKIVEKGIFNKIYRPNDDTFLFLQALDIELKFILSLNPTYFIEIGQKNYLRSGSGMLINNIAYWFKQNNQFCNFIATDINQDAANFTLQFSQCHNLNVEVIQTNITSSIQQNSVDIVISNPPYVVTSKEELQDAINENQRLQNRNGLGVSYAGGEYGMEITWKIIEQALKILKHDGTFYLLLIEDNQPEQVIQYMKSQGFCHQVQMLFKDYYIEKIPQ